MDDMNIFDWSKKRPSSPLEHVITGVALIVLAIALLNTSVRILGFVAGAAAIYEFVAAVIASRDDDDHGRDD